MDLAALKRDLGDIKLEENPRLVRNKSRDFYWYSPVLKRQLENVTAEAVATPMDEDELLLILGACWRNDVQIGRAHV